MTGTKLEKRYSPSFHDDSNRKQSASKRKRDDVLRLVFAYNLIKSELLNVAGPMHNQTENVSKLITAK